MNNMIILQHAEIKASFETSTHVVEHVFKVNYVGIDSSRYRRIMRTTHGLPCACELA